MLFLPLWFSEFVVDCTWFAEEQRIETICQCSDRSQAPLPSSSVFCRVTRGQTGVFLVLPDWPLYSWETSSHDTGLKFLVNSAKHGPQSLVFVSFRSYQENFSLTVRVKAWSLRTWGFEVVYLCACVAAKQSTPYFRALGSLGDDIISVVVQ